MMYGYNVIHASNRIVNKGKQTERDAMNRGCNFNEKEVRFQKLKSG